MNAIVSGSDVEFERLDDRMCERCDDPASVRVMLDVPWLGVTVPLGDMCEVCAEGVRRQEQEHKREACQTCEGLRDALIDMLSTHHLWPPVAVGTNADPRVAACQKARRVLGTNEVFHPGKGGA